MKELDRGHHYMLDNLDGNETQLLRFVKRYGSGYPGNTGAYQGTNVQEVLRALIKRMAYLKWQAIELNDLASDEEDAQIIQYFRGALYLLEQRAARRHDRILRLTGSDFEHIEELPVCKKCGHIGCEGKCRSH